MIDIETLLDIEEHALRARRTAKTDGPLLQLYRVATPGIIASMCQELRMRRGDQPLVFTVAPGGAKTGTELPELKVKMTINDGPRITKPEVLLPFPHDEPEINPTLRDRGEAVLAAFVVLTLTPVLLPVMILEPITKHFIAPNQLGAVDFYKDMWSVVGEIWRGEHPGGLAS